MKIEIEVSDLEMFISGLNNALVCFGDIISSIRLGCEPGILTKNKIALEAIGEEKLETRYKELVNIYTDLIDLERRMNDDKRS